MESSEGQGAEGHEHDPDALEAESLEAAGKDAVPLYRFRQVIAARNKAVAELRKLRPRAEQAATFEGRIAELEAAHAADTAAWQEERGLMAAGLTSDEGLDVARTLYRRLPEEDRPGLAEWVGGLKEDPSKMPPALAPYLGGGKTGLPGTKGTSGGAGAPTEDPLSAEQIRAIAERCQRTGDWTAWREIRSSVFGAE